MRKLWTAAYAEAEVPKDTRLFYSVHDNFGTEMANEACRFTRGSVVLVLSLELQFAWEDTFIKPHGTPYRFQIESEFFDESM